MYHTLESFDKFLFSIETEIVDVLYEYKLLTEFTMDVRKLLTYYITRYIGERILADSDLIFCHNNKFSADHELFKYYDKELLIKELNKICKKAEKSVHKIIYLKKNIDVPARSHIDDLDGSVIDEILLLKPADPKKLKEFLRKIHLKDLFANLSKRVCS